MIEINDNTVLITRDDGTTDEWRLYFYFTNDKRGKSYYYLFKQEDPDSLIVMASSDGKTLEELSEEEFAEAEEMLATYEEDPTIESVRS